MLTPVTVALDWTPNTNHIGLYVAKANGSFEKAGLDVTLLSPHLDNYHATPASRVADGTALLAVTPSESVVSSVTQPAGSKKPRLVALAALQQINTSAIVTLKSSGLHRPASLDNSNYASYGARYEGRIVQCLIRADGGKGEYTESCPPMLGIWNTLLSGTADATWARRKAIPLLFLPTHTPPQVFMPWEGVQARRAGVELNVFRLADFGIDYGYSPLLVADASKTRAHTATLSALLSATAAGFEFAAAHPDEAAEMFVKLASEENPALPEKLDVEMCKESARELASCGAWLDPATKKWGRMGAPKWEAFIAWLAKEGLLTDAVPSRTPGTVPSSTTLDALRAPGGAGAPVAPPDAATLYTNEFLP